MKLHLLTNDELNEIIRLNEGGQALSLEWRASALAAHPFLITEVKRSRELLKRIEWYPDINGWICAECKRYQHGGHKEGCELKSLIGE
jgi:hypothetical protein